MFDLGKLPNLETQPPVTPANAGAHLDLAGKLKSARPNWIPSFDGMTLSHSKSSETSVARKPSSEGALRFPASIFPGQQCLFDGMTLSSVLS